VLQRVLAHDQTTLVARYTEEAVKFIREHRDERFFLYLPHSAVHFPIYPGKAFQGKSNNGIYGDWVEEVDWSVGQVLDTVRELGLSENTLVIFTSDNGGTKRAVNAPLRGYKGSTLEGGMRVPTIAWWPGEIPAGTETGAVTGMMDILPTFVKLAGGSPPTDRRLDGGDIWPILTGKARAESPHDVFYYYRGLKLEAVRSGSWKLHLKRQELYNLETDIGESTNVAEANQEVVRHLRTLAQQMQDDLGLDGIGPGCRPLGKVPNAQPIINHDGVFRSDL
jgi:arylsulfatase A-like enzyme